MSKTNVATITPTAECPVAAGQPEMAFKMAFWDQAALETSRALDGESSWLTEKVMRELVDRADYENAVADGIAHARLGGFADIWFDEIPLEVAIRVRGIRKSEKGA